MSQSLFTVQFFEYPDRLHWRHDMVRLGEDEHGVWVGLRSGGSVQRGYEPPRRHPYDLLSVISDGAWLIFSPSDPRFSLSVDICTPPKWTSNDRVETFDLDLDMALGPDGTVSVLDQDEFDEHRVRYSYPERWSSERRRRPSTCFGQSRPEVARSMASPTNGSACSDTPSV